MRTFNIRSSSPLMRRFFQLLDVALVTLAGLGGYFWYVGDSDTGTLRAQYFSVIMLGSILLLVVSSIVYRHWRGGSLASMLGRTTASWLVAWTLVVMWLVFTKTSSEYSRVWLMSWASIALYLLIMQRLVLRLLLRWLRNRGHFHRNVLLVGKQEILQDLQQRTSSGAWTGYKIVGSITADDPHSLERMLENMPVDEVWIGLPMCDNEGIQNVLYALRYSTANVRLMPDLFSYRLMNHGVSMVMGMPMLDLSNTPMSGLNQILKAVEDRIFAMLILLLISPLMIAIAIGVKLSSPGPIIFKQRRHGWNGEEINVYKFRSMVVHEEHNGTVTQARTKDPRVTPFGAFIRRTSLDELPQFINVLQGRMSIVGPRPHALAHNGEYRELIPRYMLRHKVKPGITGWAQIHGLRGETNTIGKMQSRVQFDLFYIENWSVWLDIKIILLTVIRGFVDKNAY